MQDSPHQGDETRTASEAVSRDGDSRLDAAPDQPPETLGDGLGAPAPLPGAAEAEGGSAAEEAAVLAAMAAADPVAARALQAAWGEDLPARLDQARRAARAFASPDLVRALEDSGLGDHPALIRVAAEVGRLLDAGSDPAPNRGPDLDGAALESLEAEIDRLHALQFARPQEYRSERTQRALARLYARRYGGGGAVGPAGRRP